MNSKAIRHVIDWGGLMDFFILGFVLQSLNIVLTVIALALLVVWIKK